MTPNAGSPSRPEILHFKIQKKLRRPARSKMSKASVDGAQEVPANSDSSHMKEMNANLESQTDRLINSVLSGADEGIIERRDHSDNLRSAGIEDVSSPNFDSDQNPDDIDFDEGVRETPGSSRNESIE
jgi:hypothetical protein